MIQETIFNISSVFLAKGMELVLVYGKIEFLLHLCLRTYAAMLTLFELLYRQPLLIVCAFSQKKGKRG